MCTPTISRGISADNAGVGGDHVGKEIENKTLNSTSASVLMYWNNSLLWADQLSSSLLWLGTSEAAVIRLARTAVFSYSEFSLRIFSVQPYLKQGSLMQGQQQTRANNFCFGKHRFIESGGSAELILLPSIFYVMWNGLIPSFLLPMKRDLCFPKTQFQFVI